MTSGFLPPPTREELLTLPLHELLRDYPELGPLLELPRGREGELGWTTLPESLVVRAREVLGWRGASKGGSG